MADKDKDSQDNLTPDTPDTPAEEPKKETHKKKKKDPLEDRLEEIETELKEIKDKYLRTLAEAENLKKRTAEEIKRERKYAGMLLADKLIDQLEVFDRSLGVETDDKQFQNFLQGFRMIKDMLYQALASEGVAPLETKVGDVFDPTREHALDTRYEPDKPEHTILEITKKGYLYKDRLLRPAMVIINLNPETKAQTSNEDIDQSVA